METKTEHHEVKKDAHGKTEHHTVETHKTDAAEANHFVAQAEKIEQRFKFREILIFLLVLGLGMAAAWGINRAIKNNKDKETKAPDSSIELPNYGTPDPGITNGNQPAASQTPASQPSTPYAYPTPKQAAVPVVYTSNDFGFTFNLPVGWAHAIEESTNHEVVFYDQLNSGVISSVEIYENSSNESVDSLIAQLSRSQSVHNVHKVTINGHEWVEFDSSSGTFNHGIVTVHNNRIYYINGELSKPEFASKLSFF